MSKIKLCLGIYGMQTYFGGNIRPMIDSIVEAERAGFDQVSMTDHVVMGERTDRYPFGPWQSPLNWPWYEPIALLSAIAARTETIRLSTGVLISPLRPAVLLGKQLSTLDVISNGRLDIGIGVGWQEEEYIASGIPFEGRYTRMMEQVRVWRRQWSEEKVSVNESTVKFDNIYTHPHPIQGKNLPVWFGVAASPINCKRIAEVGDGWIPISLDPSVVKQGVDDIKTAFSAEGRDPATLDVRVQVMPQFEADGTPNLEKTLDGLQAMVEAGATMLEVLPIIFCRSPDELGKFYERVVKLKA